MLGKKEMLNVIFLQYYAFLQTYTQFIIYLSLSTIGVIVFLENKPHLLILSVGSALSHAQFHVCGNTVDKWGVTRWRGIWGKTIITELI